MKQVMITNDFHNTKYRTSKTPEDIKRILDTAPWNRTPAEKRWCRTVWQRLCGVKNCTCSNDIGARGKQSWNR